ncbi:MAG: hypothetical protein A3J35_04965 [Gammaproteobacteria bacterium RIFCSPLOWO2_02_FULL_52_10]|nr:MAG: hypothetical protein A3G96_01305 [Gammaproteobacteria bacterium RIFCSPLOWO2_12_FULL_52_10]OGT82601.1 MAG: hypothetical protein A3J35_04965 [Gammaproteobacteria bacterium RIFCSPLOWO2_02_FULL_52_10]
MRNEAMLRLQSHIKISLGNVDAHAMHAHGCCMGQYFTEFVIFYGRIVSEVSYEVKEVRA